MKVFKLFSLLSALLTLSAQASVVYDENASVDALTIVADAPEKLLSSSPEDVNRAKVVAIINKAASGSTTQTMRVYVDGALTYEWKVSTGREKLEVAKSGKKYITTTPVGYFRPTKLELNHYSNTWKAPMPHSVFFIGGIAVHASTHVSDLGKRASGGCVRLAPQNAKTFYQLVKSIQPAPVAAIARAGTGVKNIRGEDTLVTARDVLIIVENRI